MSAAHELVERGFEVSVYEKGSLPGGKARSIPVPGSEKAPRLPLPGEHGFRFFAGFYRHLPDTMKRIPHNGGTVADNLVPTTRFMMARRHKTPITLPDRFPRSIGDLQASMAFREFFQAGVPLGEVAYFAERLFQLLSACEERRYAEYDKVDWWTFVGAGTRSKAYRQFLADGMTRRFVAARAHEMSARTAGYILLQLMFDFAPWGKSMDRLLDGPTNEAWLTPWRHYLESKGVEYLTNTPVTKLQFDGKQVTGAVAGGKVVTADYYVAAFPVEVMAKLASDELKEAEPALARLHLLRTRWMNGIQFFLKRDVPLAHGHVIYADSPFALTSISQRQFWPEVELEELGDGTVGGILSVDISDWDKPGMLYHRSARRLRPEQIKDEVWAQLKAHVDLRDEDLHSWFLDPDICHAGGRGCKNAEPLLINTRNSWALRPEANTAVENLFLAADYVRTYTDLATMEGANEAARRAVNAILEVSGSSERPCDVMKLPEPLAFAPLRALDRIQFRSQQARAVAAPKVNVRALTAPPVKSIPEVIERMTAIGDALPATDGVACFNHLYLRTTQEVQKRIDKGFFSDADFMDELDVAFANLYFEAVAAAARDRDGMAKSWEVLIGRRADPRVAPLQFAVAGMNAHINHDLPLAVVSTCESRTTTPDVHHDDFVRVDTVLDEIDEPLRQSIIEGAARHHDRTVLQGVENAVDQWSIGHARASAWNRAVALWALHGQPAPSKQYESALDDLVAVVGRCLLLPVGL
jgi:uncharacterized protein with NAD-binding domain and iron-sulfur cluster